MTEQFDIDHITAQFCRIPALLRELDVTITRQDKTGTKGVGSAGHKVSPLVFNNRASDARIRLRYVVRVSGMGWMLRSYAAPTPESLRDAVSKLVTGDAWTVEHSEALDESIAEAVEAIDLPPVKAEGPSARELSAATNALAPAEEMARHISMYYEESVSPQTIRKWARNGSIEPAVIDDVQWFRVGDVLALLRQHKPELTVADRLARLASAA